MGNVTWIGRRPFRFIEAWTSDESRMDVVKEAWGSHVRGRMETHKVQRRLNVTAKAFRIWNRNYFGFAHKKIKMLERELELLQFGEGENIGNQAEIEDDPRIHQGRLEEILIQKSSEL